MKVTSRHSLAIGLSLLAIALVANPYTVGYFLAADGQIDVPLRVAMVVALEIIVGTIGLYLVLRRPSVEIDGRHVLLAVSGALTGLFAIEVITVGWLHTFASDEHVFMFGSPQHVQEHYSGRKLSPHPYLQWMPTPGYSRQGNYHNSLGYRGREIEQPKPPSQFRIVLLGGSTTYGGAHRVENSYAYLLEKKLRQAGWSKVRIINAGAPNWSTWESLLNLELRVLDLDPDAIVVYHGINDVHPRLVYPYSEYRGDNSASRSDAAFKRYESVIYKSAVARVLGTAAGFRSSAGALIPTRKSPHNYASEFREQKIDGNYPSGIFVEHPASEMLERNRPIYFKRNIENMIAVARNNDIVPVLMTFAWSHRFTDQPRVHSSEYQSAYRDQNRVIETLCSDYGLQCLDFEREMPDRKELWWDGRHVTPKGAEVKSDIVKEFLARQLMPRVSP